jgi:fructose-1,6-bisphosphatase/inositol monophosphatase family enzyme
MNQEYLDFAKRLARDAGDVMLKYFNQSGISHYKGDDTIVTKADTEINQMVIDRVREAYSEHGVYGEEDSFGRDKNTLWVCDPVDGTAMFARGVPTAVFSLALVKDGEPQVGVVYDLFTDRLYSAVKGEGAFCDDTPISVNKIEFGDMSAVSNCDIWPKAEIFNKMQVLLDELNKKT